MSLTDDDRPEGFGLPGTFTSKPRTVRAIQWTGENLAEVERFTLPAGVRTSGPHPLIRTRPGDRDLHLWTAKGGSWTTVRRGDFVIAERDGSGFYPCEGATFEANYLARWNAHGEARPA